MKGGIALFVYGKHAGTTRDSRRGERRARARIVALGSLSLRRQHSALLARAVEVFGCLLLSVRLVG
jgi:tRNA pseudouridine-54 N-methylase